MKTFLVASFQLSVDKLERFRIVFTCDPAPAWCSLHATDDATQLELERSSIWSIHLDHFSDEWTKERRRGRLNSACPRPFETHESCRIFTRNSSCVTNKTLAHGADRRAVQSAKWAAVSAGARRGRARLDRFPVAIRNPRWLLLLH